MLLCLYGDELWCEELCVCIKLKSKLWWLSICVHYNSWRARASTEQERRVYWLEEGEEVRDGTAERSSAMRWRASSDFIHAWHWWHRFWFLIGFNSILSILLKKTVQWHLGSIFFFFSSHHRWHLSTGLQSLYDCCDLFISFYAQPLCLKN